MIEKIINFLNYTIFRNGDFNVKLINLIILSLFIVGIFIILLILKRSIYSLTKFDDSKKYSLYSLIKYFTYVVSLVVSLQIIGFNLSILLAGSAALLVGLGLGVQNLFSDYISGIIILLDSTVKVGDIIELNGIICKVQEIHLRTTKVLTRDDTNIILPNTDLTRSRIINWTLNDVDARFEIKVGVDYSSDINLVMNLMVEAANSVSLVQQTPKPFVRFVEFSDSSIDFTVHFWLEEVFRAENIKSDIRIKIFELFTKNNVKIPFPQRVIHSK